MNTAVLKVIKPGPHTLIQDGGRRGALHLGLTSAGPMDRLSFDWANRLCGNAAHTAALEITFGGLELEALQPVVVVITGPPAPVTLNGTAVDTWQGLALSRGDRLAVGSPRSGCRLYLAVAGGFTGQQAFGSVATVPREQLGGIAGRALLAGDSLALAAASPHRPRRFALPPPLRPAWADGGREVVLRVVPCLQARDFAREAKRLFFSQSYLITPHCDRMGYRLAGEPLAPPAAESLSQAIIPGTIQIPGDGQPIVLMRDHQTLGGYPRLGVVVASDLDRLAQLPPGMRVRFAAVTLQGARRAMRDARRHFEQTCPVALDCLPL